MRSFLVLLAGLAALPSAAAQSVTVAYTVTTRIDLPPEARAQLAAMGQDLPSSRTERRLLYVSDAAALTVPAPEAAPEGPTDFSERGGRRFRMGHNQDETRTFVDLNAGTQVQQRDFLGRSFLITGEPEAVAWRLTDERAEFLGHPCQKAVGQRDSTRYEAWFAPGLPAGVGPDGFGGLPGLILVLTVDGGRRAVTATEISFAPPPEGTLVAPTEGRRVTRAEFDALVEERLREMRGTRRGGVIIMGP